VFSSIVDDAVRAEINKADGLVLDVFERFIVPLETSSGRKSTARRGAHPQRRNVKDYNHRIEAINYTLAHDDGVTHRGLEEADIVLRGRVAQRQDADLPLPGDAVRHQGGELSADPRGPRGQPHAAVAAAAQAEGVGLSITPERLHQIRSERRPDSRYAASTTAATSGAAEKLMRQAGIPYLDSTTKSIEEIATHCCTRRIS
jgi:regulator of PEP synthase PpsR (kinase-PPPase family)